jgi:hypothetical protein
MFIRAEQYWSTLCLFFFLWLSLFHLVLASWTTISKRFVRGTDYVYFGLAVIGIVIAGIAQEQERRESYINFVSSFPAITSHDLATAITGLSNLCDYIPWVESSFVFKLTPHVIRRLFLPDTLQSDTCTLLSEAVLILENQNYSAIPQWRNTQRNMTNLGFHIFRGPGQLLSDVLLQNLGFAMDSVYYHNSSTSKSTASVATLIPATFKYLLTQLWPFVLVLAIALRMTRVTADVTDWPIDHPKNVRGPSREHTPEDA